MNIDPGYHQLPEHEIREGLARLTVWDGLKRSDRLRGLLEYIVEEALAGRGSAIRAKTIGMDVYGYSVEDLKMRESVVRVDVGRLRRKLGEYYREVDDTIRITLPKGSYAPLFTREAAGLQTAADSAAPRHTSPSFRWLLLGSLVGVLAISVFLVFWGRETVVSDRETNTSRIERTVIFDASPNRLRAINLAEEGRDLVFPALSPRQLETALTTFDAALAADDTYFGGHAGAAQVYAAMALIATDNETATQSLRRAVESSQRAMELSPQEAWSQSAAAFTSFAAGDYESATQRSVRSVRIDPDDPHIVEFDALISLYAGDFQRVIAETARIEKQTSGERGYVFRNAAGSAHYHLGDYQEAIDAFEASIASGGPIGPPSLAYLIAANQRLGRTDRAEELVDQYLDAWPQARIDLVLRKLFSDPSHAEDLVSAMVAAGWSPE